MMQAASTSCPGIYIQIPHNSNTIRKLLISKLSHMVLAVDACPLTIHQKLRLFKIAICPRLTRLLKIEDRPLNWVGRNCKQWPHASSRGGMGWRDQLQQTSLSFSSKGWTSPPSTHITILEPTNSQTVPSTDLIQLQHQTSRRGSPGGWRQGREKEVQARSSREEGHGWWPQKNMDGPAHAAKKNVRIADSNARLSHLLELVKHG